LLTWSIMICGRARVAHEPHPGLRARPEYYIVSYSPNWSTEPAMQGHPRFLASTVSAGYPTVPIGHRVDRISLAAGYTWLRVGGCRSERVGRQHAHVAVSSVLFDNGRSIRILVPLPLGIHGFYLAYTKHAWFKKRKYLTCLAGPPISPTALSRRRAGRDAQPLFSLGALTLGTCANLRRDALDLSAAT